MPRRPGIGGFEQPVGGACVDRAGHVGVRHQAVDTQRHRRVELFFRDQPVVDQSPMGGPVRGLIHAAGRAGVHHVGVLRVHREGHDVVDLFHAVHAFFPVPAAVLRPEGADGRRHVDDIGVAGVEQELVDHRDVFFQAPVVRRPALAAVGALIHGVAHGAGQDIRGAVRVHAQRKDAEAAQVRRHFVPGRSAVAGLVERFVGGHVGNVGIPRMRRDGHDGVALAAAGGGRQHKTEKHQRTHENDH